jgi:transposase InsO family protein
VLDLAYRRVVGWSMSASLQRDIVLDALRAGIDGRKPKRSLQIPGKFESGVTT